MKEIERCSNPLLDVIIKCACGALDQADCNYILVMFGSGSDELQKENVALHIKDEQAAVDSLVKVIKERSVVSNQLLHIIVNIIDKLPLGIWQQFSVSNINTSVNSQKVSSDNISESTGISI